MKRQTLITVIKRLPLILLTLAVLPGCGETIDGLVDDVNKGIELGRAEARGQKGSERLLTDSCPRIQIVDDLGSLSDFTDQYRMNLEHLIARMDINKGKSSCDIANSSATVDMTLKFVATLGPKARQSANDKPFLTYPFFVAITGPNGKILAKEVFAVSMGFDKGQNTRTHTEYLRQIIPIKGPDVAYHYQVLVGFQLSPEQLAYNRAALSPKNVPIPKHKPRITYVPVNQAGISDNTVEDLLREKALVNQDTNATTAPIPVTKEVLP